MASRATSDAVRATAAHGAAAVADSAVRSAASPSDASTTGAVTVSIRLISVGNLRAIITWAADTIFVGVALVFARQIGTVVVGI